MTLSLLTGRERHPEFIGEGLNASPPPYDFEGVTLRYFPLKANFQTLANFCDDYLNMAPDIAYFRPAMPFVLLVIVNYGRMSQHVGNLGWTSQNELLFSVPLEWYRTENGEFVFHDLATVSPFIFVDSDSSQSAGREILGWPKVQGWFSKNIDPWARHPRNRREVLTLTTRVFEELYEGEASKPKELLVVEEEPAPTFTEFPPDPANPLNPLVSIPKAMVGWSTLALQAIDMTARLSSRGYSDLDRGVFTRLAQFMRTQENLGRSLQSNTINLKQMRDAGEPTVACYQAITNARMQVTQFHRGGLLGDQALLRGDTSGGFRIRINRFESQPIIDVLGLEVEEERTQDELSSSYLKPVMPFWQEMDLRYLEAANICWRTRERDWRTDKVESVDDTRIDDPHFYNTTGSAGLQVATGPFSFVNTTIRVLPLLADHDKLDKIVKESLPNGVAEFEAYGRYVYMIITSFTKMHSESNDMGTWADKKVEFAIPVRWREKTPGDPDNKPGDDAAEKRKGDLVSTGYFSPFIFSNSTIGVTTGREVYGWPVVEAQILSPSSVWLDESGPVADVVPYLDVKAEVFPALNVGQESDWRTVFEVDNGNLLGWQDRQDWNAVADHWGREIKADVTRMATAAQDEKFDDLRALALEILGNGQPLNQFSFKQFRDAGSDDLACYQALVQRRTIIERVHDLREMEDRAHVKVHRYPTQEIVDKLGLVVQSSYLSDTGRVDCLQPSRHFYLKANLRVELPENVCWRSLSDKWEKPSCPAKGYFAEEEPAPVGRDLVGYLDTRKSDLQPNPFAEADQNPQRLRHKCGLWSAAAKSTAAQEKDHRLARSDAANVVADDKFEPQMVIHAMLSGEWDHFGNPRWYQQEQQEKRNAERASKKMKFVAEIADDEDELPIDPLPMFVIRRDSVGQADKELFPESERVRNVGSGADYWSPTSSST